VPESYYRLRFNTIIRELQDDDPTFARHLRDIPQEQRRRRRRWAGALWLLAPMLIIIGGWTGLLLAVIASCVGVLLVWRPYAIA
jgi:hypothetical protein